MAASADTLFSAGALRARELGDEDIPGLQRFFENNPEYFYAVTGEGPTPSEARDEIHGTQLQGWSFSRKWTLGFVDAADTLVGMANVVSDILAPGVWHIGLLIVATRLHGSGAARSMYAHLERWMRESGAQWLRLGVVEGNARAERFWERSAYVEVRKREGVEMGKLFRTVRVMVKPMAGGDLGEYLTLVARDRPEAG
jgi:ribosomal protein S18 acetylase RimI-like enzyme